MIEFHCSRNGITECMKELVLVIMKKEIQGNGTAVIARRTRCQLNYDTPFERKWLI